MRLGTFHRLTPCPRCPDQNRVCGRPQPPRPGVPRRHSRVARAPRVQRPPANRQAGRRARDDVQPSPRWSGRHDLGDDRRAGLLRAAHGTSGSGSRRQSRVTFAVGWIRPAPPSPVVGQFGRPGSGAEMLDLAVAAHRHTSPTAIRTTRAADARKPAILVLVVRLDNLPSSVASCVYARDELFRRTRWARRPA